MKALLYSKPASKSPKMTAGMCAAALCSVFAVQFMGCKTEPPMVPKQEAAPVKEPVDAKGIPKNEYTAELERKCGTNDAISLTEGSTIAVKNGRQVKAVHIGDMGAAFLLGEKNPKNGTAKYATAVYVPKGSTFGFLDPALVEGKEEKRLANVDGDVVLYICETPTAPGTLGVVKTTYGNLEGLVHPKEDKETRTQKLTARREALLKQLGDVKTIDQLEGLLIQMRPIDTELVKLQRADK